MQYENTFNQVEYELLSITIEQPYELPEDDVSWCVSEEGPQDTVKAEIEYDKDGVPMGNSSKEYKMRQQIIIDFLHKWGENNTDRKILNDALSDYIFIKNISVIETKEHSAKRYKSTRAVLILDEVLRNAKPVGRVPVKKDNKNQSVFTYMLVMVYRHEELGAIKLTVGVKPNVQYVQYGLTVLDSKQPLIERKKNDTTKTKKRRPHK